MDIKELYLNSQSHKIISLDKSRESLSHAYLIECADTFVLDEYVSYLSKEIFCLNDNTPCDNCINCQKIIHSNMVDLKCFPKENKSIMVDDINEIVADTLERPMDAKYKLYILRNFEEATMQAQNKLLKTIEEPPQNVIFILTCSNLSGVLPTIRSRVKLISEPLLNVDTIDKYLSGLGVVNAREISAMSGGKMSVALKLIKGNASGIIELAFNLLANLKTSADILKYSSLILGLKKDLSFFIDAMQLILRDVAIGHHEDMLYFKDKINELKALAKVYNAGVIEKITLKLCEVHNKLEFNCNLTGVVDKLLLDILEVKFLCQK